MIEVRNLVKHYGSIRAVEGVSFKVNKGDILGFLGPNGAGKSTTMKMITGFISPTSGTALVNGFDVLETPIQAKQCIGYLPESAPVYGEMNVQEFLGFIAEVRGFFGDVKTQKMERVIQYCHLEHVRRQTIETLSKGYRQRVGFAQALIHEPPVLILDEPTDGLDPNQKHEARNLIKRMATNKAIILSTHILEEVEALCNRVIIIDHGKVLVDETPEAMRRRNPSINAVKITINHIDLAEVEAQLAEQIFVERVELTESGCVVYPKDKAVIDEALLNFCSDRKWQIGAFEKINAALDAVFRDLTSN